MNQKQGKPHFEDRQLFEALEREAEKGASEDRMKHSKSKEETKKKREALAKSIVETGASLFKTM